jgi:hypothetical protein
MQKQGMGRIDVKGTERIGRIGVRETAEVTFGRIGVKGIVEVALLAFSAMKCVEEAAAGVMTFPLPYLHGLIPLVWLSSVMCGVGCVEYDSISDLGAL